MLKQAAAGISGFWAAAVLMAESNMSSLSTAVRLSCNCTAHHHGRIGNPADKPYGNGVLLWFEVDDFDAVMERAAEMNVEIVMPRHRNPPNSDGGPNHWECWIRDPDGYTVVVASPYGTADGNWRPGPDLFT